MGEEPYSPDIEEGFIKISFFSYSASALEVLKYSLQWLVDHPEYDIEDFVFGEDEGTFVTVYCKKK